MNRRQSELRRLYLLPPAADEGAGVAGVLDARGGTRALVLEVVRPADPEAVARAWRGVQAELGLPAPAVAVNGVDGLQLWLSLEAPLGQDEAQAFLDGLHHRFLAELPDDRVLRRPGAADPVSPLRIPGGQVRPGQWSAFVKPDLAVLFADTPWLDVEPGGDGQADLLAGLRSIDREAFAAACARLGVTAKPAAEPVPGRGDAPSSRAAGPASPQDPEGFLLQVMRDETAPLALRVEAAKVLLAHGRGG